MSKRQLLSGISGLLTVIVAWALWIAVEHAVTVQGASDLVVPLVTAGAFVVAFILTAVLAPRIEIVLVTVVLAMALALSVAVSMVLAIGVGVSMVLLLLARRDMIIEMNARIDLNISAIATTGFGRIVLAVTVVIATLYYTLLIQHDAASLALSNSLRSVTGSSILRTMMPAPLTTDKENGQSSVVTVDDFIAHMITKQVQSSGSGAAVGESVSFMEQYAQALSDRFGDIINLDNGIGAQLRNTITAQLPQSAGDSTHNLANNSAQIPVQLSTVMIASARTQLSEQFGMPLVGTEPVADVFVQFAQTQLQSYTEESVLPAGYRFSTALAGVMAVFLFITISWIGSMLRFVAVPIVRIIFWILRKVGAVDIIAVQITQEKLS